LLLVIWNKADNAILHDRLILLRDLAYSPIPGCQSFSYDSKKFEEQEVATTKATRIKRNKTAMKRRQKSLSTVERVRASAAFEQERQRCAAMKIQRQQRSKDLRDANLSAQEQVQAERQQRREDHQDHNLEGLDFLL
jgi:hypothetical protein